MNRGFRQFLVCFILLCVIALAVLVVQVFFFGERAPEDELTATVGGESAPPDEKSPEDTPPVGTSSGDTDTLEDTPPDDNKSGQTSPEDTPPPEGMERATIEVPDVGRLVVDYYGNDFVRDQTEFGDSFLYISPDDGYAEMKIMLRAGMQASDAPHFFDGSDSETPMDVIPGGAKSVGRTGLTGQFVMAVSDSLTYEAWLIDIDGGVLVFELSYSTDFLQQVLHDQLDAVRLA